MINKFIFKSFIFTLCLPFSVLAQENTQDTNYSFDSNSHINSGFSISQNSVSLKDKHNIVTNGINADTLKDDSETQPKTTNSSNSNDNASIDLSHIKYIDSSTNNIGSTQIPIQEISVDMDKIRQNPVVSVDIQIVQKSHNASTDIVKLDSSLITYSGMPNGLSYEAPNRLTQPIIHSDYLQAAPDSSENIHNNSLLDNTISYSLTPLMKGQNVVLNGMINFYIISATNLQVAEKHNINVNSLVLSNNKTQRIDLNNDYYLNFTFTKNQNK
jgi:hypothetical protein